MGEENPCEKRGKSSKISDQNCPALKGKAYSSSNKPRPSWGSQIVKGFSVEKKSKPPVKKVPLGTSSLNDQKNPPVAAQQVRVKRSLIGDLSCSVNATQVHPQGVQFINRTKSPGSRDLLLEIDHLRRLLQESKDREAKLLAELSDCKRSPKVLELERELDLKKGEIDCRLQRVSALSDQLISPAHANCSKGENGLEIEVLELRRLNKELQLQKRNLSCKISSMQSHPPTPAKLEGDTVEKMRAESSLLRQTNEDLCKQVEGLQMSRLNEVEELAYLRWVNSCLRNELRNFSSDSSDKTSSPDSVETSCNSDCSLSLPNDENAEFISTAKWLSLIKKWKKWPITEEDLQNSDGPDNFVKNTDWFEALSTKRRHSISNTKCSPEDIVLNPRRQSYGFIFLKEVETDPVSVVPQICDLGLVQRSEFWNSTQEGNEVKPSLDVKKRALRIPNPPPRPSCTTQSENTEVEHKAQIRPPPPPPPPPPPKFTTRGNAGMVQRAPQVVEFYHSLMKRDSRRDSLSGGVADASDVANVRTSMIGEIENRSSHLLAIKEDVETQGEFVNSLIQEVNEAVYPKIEDVVAFVKWLDEELCFLVDERAVLKHFDWPEKKADTLREAAFGYRDLKKLEYEISNYKEDSRLPSDIALKKMVTLTEKMERVVYSLVRTRDTLMRNCKEFNIPTDWMLDSGILSKIKLGSVKMAKMYMKRVAMELKSKGTSEKDSSMDYMLLQGVRFAFRVHQFAGGFDAETMHAFEELRNLALILNQRYRERKVENL